MNKYPNFWDTLFSHEPRGFFFGYVVVAIIAAFGMIIIMATQKYKSVERSPEKWSWSYFWADNLGKFVAGIFLIPIFIRLVIERVDAGWMIPLSIGLGFGFLALAKLATNFGIWTTNSLSKKIADKIKQQEEKDK